MVLTERRQIVTEKSERLADWIGKRDGRHEHLVREVTFGLVSIRVFKTRC